MYDLQPINNLLCFVVDRASGEIVWFSAHQSWWAIEAARRCFAPTAQRAE